MYLCMYMTILVTEPALGTGADIYILYICTDVYKCIYRYTYICMYV